MSLWEIYKAKRLGYADDLWTSLIGHQLGGYSWQSDYETTPYLYRAMPNLSHYYNREIMEEVVGGTVGWNQLCNGSSVTVQSGHKYFLKKGSAESVATSAGSAITGLTSGSDIVVDLTLVLGSTIADYVYSLEQATAGSGVAWLKEHFPRMCQYNPYDAGSIQSVSGLVSHTTKDANDNVIGSYPLDSTLTLRGIPKLDNGKLYYDGDTYGADGTVNRKYGVVDLGTLNWTLSSTGVFWASAPNGVSGNAHGSLNAICVKYTTVYDKSMAELEDKELEYGRGVYIGDGEIAIKDSSYSTADSFKSAMSGVYLVYELATPTTETAQPFTKTQLCDSGGTEEFVATGVNVWDEEWEVGTLDYNQASASFGENATSSAQIRSKNFIPVMPNKDYYFKIGVGTNGFMICYDADKKAIKNVLGGNGLGVSGRAWTMPSNCHYVRFYCIAEYGTTYNHDISINYPSIDTAYHPYGCLVSVGHKSKYAEK